MNKERDEKLSAEEQAEEIAAGELSDDSLDEVAGGFGNFGFAGQSHAANQASYGAKKSTYAASTAKN